MIGSICPIRQDKRVRDGKYLKDYRKLPRRHSMYKDKAVAVEEAVEEAEEAVEEAVEEEAVEEEECHKILGRRKHNFQV